MAGWNELLREARKHRGLSQQELAVQAHVVRKTVSNYERGVGNPSRGTLLALTAALDMDSDATDTLLADAGFDPEPSGLLAHLKERSPSLESMQRAIDEYAWPCLILSDSMEILIWNAPSTWVAELDFATLFPDPAERSLMRVAALQHFRDRVLNWEEVVSVMMSVVKADFEDPERYTAAMPWFANLVQDLSTKPEYQRAFPAMMQLWQSVVPHQEVSRIPFPVCWRLSTGTVLQFNCMLSSWNDFDSAGAFDWLPADAATATWLHEKVAEHAPRVANETSAPDRGIEKAAPIPAWNELLRSAREKSGFTQPALAGAADISEHAVFSYESGRRRPSRATVMRMAEAMHLDGATTNLLLTGIGHAPVASEIVRSIAGLRSSDPRFRSGRWQAAARQTQAGLASAIEMHSWPCLVLNGDCRLLAANGVAQHVLGRDIDHQTLVQLLVSPSFRERVLNYDEVASALAPSRLKQAAADAVEAARFLPLRSFLEAKAETDPVGVADLEELWEAAPPGTLSTRATFPVLWRTNDGSVLSFFGIISLWSDYLWYWALDWHPADAATWAWLEG